MQTIKEAANEFLKSSNTNDFPYHRQGVIDSFEAGVKFAQKFISIDDELPENRQELLLDVKSKKQTVLLNGRYGNKKTKVVLVQYRDGTFDVAERFKLLGDDYYYWTCLESFEKNNPKNIISWRPIELNK